MMSDLEQAENLLNTLHNRSRTKTFDFYALEYRYIRLTCIILTNGKARTVEGWLYDLGFKDIVVEKLAVNRYRVYFNVASVSEVQL